MWCDAAKRREFTRSKPSTNYRLDRLQRHTTTQAHIASMPASAALIHRETTAGPKQLLITEKVREGLNKETVGLRQLFRMILWLAQEKVSTIKFRSLRRMVSEMGLTAVSSIGYNSNMVKLNRTAKFRAVTFSHLQSVWLEDCNGNHFVAERCN
jgi:hypothetical protein